MPTNEQKIKHLEKYQLAFDELMGEPRVIAEYFREYANQPDLYERVCADLGIAPLSNGGN